MKARIFVRLRPGVLDPQGATIRKALEGLGFPEVRDLRVGKVLELTLEETDRARAQTRLDEMCRRLLANPVIEDYSCEVEESGRQPSARPGEVPGP
ncbi:MAG TPA: phosphoribosylformylglycinamidine synthase subunit PurS [Methylomirabilota bacterium]|nr:phosphoribosylformylglycinamidine synthase subunit PurS [Methylomirabilota bacterium]